MRNFIVFQMFIMALTAFVALPEAGAGDWGKLTGNLGKYFWGHPKAMQAQPYLENAKLPHNSRWADDEWTPQDWIDSRGGDAISVINGFYEAGIVSDQYFDDEIPVLEVGQGFIDLGAQDKRRVVAFIDEVFGVTKFAEPGVILLYFHSDEKEVPIGMFNAQGLQLQ